MVISSYFPDILVSNFLRHILTSLETNKKTYDETGRLNINQRPIRISGPTGERTALNSSEYIPAGSRCKLRIGMTNQIWRKAIEEWLDYGQIRGIGQWRNSSSGLFRWRELDSNWMPKE